MREASWYEREQNGDLRCLLCPHRCLIKADGRGLCGVRENRDGTLIATNYAQVASMAIDPIEKKPLARYRPGSRILSVGTYGCNMFCPYCQNASLSRGNECTVSTTCIAPDDLVAIAERSNGEEGNIGIAFTYNEPTVWFEYVLAVAEKMKERGLDVVLVSNGCIEEGPLRELIPFVDAMNVDLKSFRADTYRKRLKGDLDSVLRTIRFCASRVHLEVTTLLVPTLNDDLREVREIARFLAGVDPTITLHLSRFFPRHEMCHLEPTDVTFMQRAVETARKELEHVQTGNL